MEHDLNPYEEPDGGSFEERVGYGNPPKHTRWPRGYCPNPSGRPRKAKGRKAILQRIATERCQVKVGGKVMELIRVEVVLVAVRNAFANGNPTAQKLVDKLLHEKHDEAEPTLKGTLILGEKMTDEEWDLEYGYSDGGHTPSPPPKPIGMAQVRHLLKRVPEGFEDYSK